MCEQGLQVLDVILQLLGVVGGGELGGWGVVGLAGVGDLGGL